MVRCHLFLKDGEIQTSSRGGKNYNFATQYIIENPIVQNFFENYPDVILDGELYVHGRSLQQISGTCRIEDYNPKKEEQQKHRIQELEFWVYDIVDETSTFEERLSFIEDELISYFDNNPKVKICEHVKVEGWLYIEKLHNKFVEEGYEGLVLRAPDKEYKCDARDNRMIKVKMYQDAEFEIIGWKEGLRPIEDMVFTCLCNNKEFYAKPMGAREVKEEYVENMDQIIGKFATVKFFNYTDEGVPAQPVLKTIRDYE